MSNSKNKNPSLHYTGSVQLYDHRAVLAIFGGRSGMWLWRHVKDGTLPQPLLIAGRRYWRQDEINEVIERFSNYREEV